MTVQPTRDQLRALANAATEGPWMHDRDQYDGWMVVFGGNEYPHGYSIIGSNEYLEPEDAAFIAAARTALPQLLDQLDQQETELDSWMARAYEAEKRAWQAERRIARLEAQTNIRGRAVVMYRERARKSEAAVEYWRKQYAQDVEYWIKETDTADARIKAVRELHAKEPGVGAAYCIDCEQPLPCDTIRALDT